MIGHVNMEIGEQEMIAMVQAYLTELFTAGYGSREKNKPVVTGVRQRSNGRFIIDFDGIPERQEQQFDNGSGDLA
jgi:hypothetical protein